jgi:hypothetical protein
MPPKPKIQRVPCTLSDYKEHFQPEKELKENGIVVVPFLDVQQLSELRTQFDTTLQNFPEFTTTPTNANGQPYYVLGGFSALGNPASFHNPFVRILRQWVMASTVKSLWSPYVTKYHPDAKLEQIIDRMMMRPSQVATSAESWHRDEAVQAEGQFQETFGGWINLDDTSQYFNCVKGTHSAVNTGKGFASIKNAEEKKRYEHNCSSVEIPPGHLVVFYEHIVHEVLGKKKPYPIYRLFVGWRVTSDDNPLIPNNVTELKNKLQTQAVMKLKSNQISPMYAKLHWCNWREKILDFSEHFREECKILKKVESGKEQGKIYNIIPQTMDSLQAYGFEMYPSYKIHEISMHVPGKEWKILVPGRTRIRKTIYL